MGNSIRITKIEIWNYIIILMICHLSLDTKFDLVTLRELRKCFKKMSLDIKFDKKKVKINVLGLVHWKISWSLGKWQTSKSQYVFVSLHIFAIRDITDKTAEFVLLLYHSVYGVFRSVLKIFSYFTTKFMVWSHQMSREILCCFIL